MKTNLNIDGLKTQIESLLSENAQLKAKLAKFEPLENLPNGNTNSLLASLLDNSPAVIFTKKIDGTYILANKRCVKLFNKTEDKILGKTDFDIFPDEYAKLYAHNDSLVLNANGPLQFESKVPYKGRYKYFVSIKFPLFDDSGKPFAICGIATDITEMKRAGAALKESEERFRNLVELSPIGIFIHNNSQILYTNLSGAKILGTDSQEQIVGKDLNDFSPGENQEFVMGKIKKVISSLEPVSLAEGKLKKLDGKIIDVEVTALPIILKKLVLVQVMMTDITDRKNALEEIITAKAKAEEANRFKSNLMANLSHEFRTPMSGILGFSEILMGEIKNPEHKTMISDIYNSGKRLFNTLNAILNLSHLTSSEYKNRIKPVDFAREVKLTIDNLKFPAEEKGLKIIFDIESENTCILADAESLHLIVNYLFDNAVKYTNSGSITISVKKDKDNMSAHLTIADTGIGIAKEYQEVIFQEFRQVSEGLSRQYEGTGLGLTLTKKMVELMGGEISLKSKQGDGSAFTVKFPVC